MNINALLLIRIGKSIESNNSAPSGQRQLNGGPEYPDYTNTPYSTVKPLIEKATEELGKLDPDWGWGYTALSLSKDEIMKLKALDEERKRAKEAEERKAIEEENAKEDYAKKTGKTIIHIKECWECGTWIILGGANGRLPHDVWRAAVDELATDQKEKWKQQSQNGKVPLARVVIGSEVNGFDLETEHFLYKIVECDDSHCAQ